MSKKVNKEEQAKAYLKELEGVFSTEEMSLIKTIFGVVKNSIGPDYYLDAINNCCRALLETKKEGLEFEPGIPVRETYKETGFTSSNVIPMRSLTTLEQLYSDEEVIDMEIVKNLIYEEYLETKSFIKLAEKYNVSVSVIKEIVVQGEVNKRALEVQKIMDILEQGREIRERRIK